MYYSEYCKNELLKFKPWVSSPQNAWDNEEQSPQIYVQNWQYFLLSEIGQSLVPEWQRLLHDASSYLSNDNNSDSEETYESDEVEMDTAEEWMFMARLVPAPETSSYSLQQIEEMRSFHSPPLVLQMPFWLESTKSLATVSLSQYPCVDITLLNKKQNIAFQIVKRHYEQNIKDPLRLMITGQGGSGKSFLINALRNLLGSTCAVSSYFGIAAHNIAGVTLHSLLQLPIRGLHQRELTGQALTSLQAKLCGEKYIIIDEFSVLEQNMLGWVDRRLRQASGFLDNVFGEYSVIIVGDIAQLPPVNDNPLYHSMPSNSTSLMGYCAYQEINKVVRLEVNQRVTNENQQKFRSLLIRLRNGNSTLEDWNFLHTRSTAHASIDYADMSVRLAYANKVVAEYNYNCLKESDQPIYAMKAKHNNPKAVKLSADNFGGLELLIHIAVDARVMVTRNLGLKRDSATVQREL